PVQETVDAVAELRATQLPVGAVLVNMTRPPRLPEPALLAAAAGTVDAAELPAGLAAAGLAAGLAGPLTAEAVEHAQRWRLEDANRGTVAALGLPTYELPFLPEPMDLGGLYALAERLRDQGVGAAA
ncbi:MAG: hypothetical protein V7637_6284, partial [Mycobacteriales bacterium]